MINILYMKIFILTGDENWICDLFKGEWIEYNKDSYTDNYNNADIIWILSDFCYKKIPMNVLLTKKVITTIHHIDMDKLDDKQLAHYKVIDSFTTKYHTICETTKLILEKLTSKEIIIIPFWVDQSKWFHIDDILQLRDKFKIPHDEFVVGSFQRDTKGVPLKMEHICQNYPKVLIYFVISLQE